MILQRYVLRELAAVLTMAFLAISAIIFIAFGVQQYTKLEGLGFPFLVQSAPFIVCRAVRFSLPAAALIATVLVYGRLAADNEIVALRAGGVHLWRVVSPALALGLWATAGFLAFNDHLAPVSIQKERHLARVGLVNTLTTPPPLGTALVISDYRIIYKEFSHGAFEELSLLRTDDSGRADVAGESEIIWARRARFKPGDDNNLPRFQLEDVTGLRTLPGKDPRDWPGLLAREIDYPLDVEQMAKRPWRLFEMTTPDLYAVLRTPGRTASSSSIRAERHQRIAWALGPFVLVLFGAPIGVLLRKGSRMAGFGASLPGGAAYFILAAMGQAYATKGGFTAAAWGADLLFGIGGAILLWRMVRV
jgi:lipopolysaccharide export system permease protein